MVPDISTPLDSTAYSPCAELRMLAGTRSRM
jgi:hypothetical protein